MGPPTGSKGKPAAKPAAKTTPSPGSPGSPKPVREPPDPKDVRQLIGLFHTLKLRMANASAVAVSSSVQLQGLKHGRVAKIEFVRHPQVEAKTLSAELLQAVLRMHLARLELARNFSSPQLARLQALAQRKRLLAPRLAAEDRAARRIQRQARGCLARRGVQELRLDRSAQRLVLGLLKALKWRQQMANGALDQATLALQTKRRATMAQRKSLALTQERQDVRTVLGIFRSYVQRQSLNQRISSRAVQTLQQGRRCQVSRRELQNRQQEKEDAQLLLSLFRAAKLRLKLARKVTEQSSVKLQKLQRGRAAKQEMARMRETAECHATLAPVLRCLSLRIHLASERSKKAARGLQASAQAVLAKRRNRHSCWERLQHLLTGLQKKYEAQELLCKLHSHRQVRTHPQSLMRVALKAVHLRKKVAQLREHHAATRIQARARGAFQRSECREVQQRWARQIIFNVCRRYAVQVDLVSQLQQQSLTEALEIWESVLKTYKERSQFAPDLLYNRASLKIACMWRGVKGRQQMRRLRLERSSQTACDQLRSFLRVYAARELLMARGAEVLRADNRQLLCSVLRTLKLRMATSHHVAEERKKAAMEVLSRHVKGMYLRSGRVFDWEAYAKRTGRRITDEIRTKIL
ncbi:unnamed protein product, partial [Effrenium voratum]